MLIPPLIHKIVTSQEKGELTQPARNKISIKQKAATYY